MKWIADPFQPGDPNTRERDRPPRHIVHHWTGGTGGAEQVARTLRSRKLSIGYVTEPDGEVWQCADDMTRTAHAGIANDDSIGVENVGLGFAREDDAETYEMTLGRQTRDVLPFPRPQLHAIGCLTTTLCLGWDIPRAYLEPVRIPPAKIARVLREFSGVLGHYHVHRIKRGGRWRSGWKWDPGTQLFDYLDAAGFERVRLADV